MSANPLVVSAHALDAGGGEGFVADAWVFAELDCRAVCVATSVVPPEPLPHDVVARQLDAARGMGPVGAVRVGFARGAPQVELIAAFVSRAAPASTVLALPVGDAASPLIDAETHEAVRRHLYPAARVVVVRAADLPFFTGREAEDLDGIRDAAIRLREQRAKAVVVSGWLSHGRVIDLLDDEGQVTVFDTARIQVPRVSGLAGAYAAALAAHLARGSPLSVAGEAAQRYIGFRLLRGR